MEHPAHWQRLQAEFLDSWLQWVGPWRELPDAASWESWEKLFNELTGAAPWASFGLFGQLLAACGEASARGRRSGSITPALQSLLADFIHGIDLALLAGRAAAPLPAGTQWPAFGPSREWQNGYAALAAAQRVEREAALALQLAQWEALRVGAAAFSASLERDDDGPPIASLRGLYDAFIDHLETAYLAQARRPDYAQAFGHYLNASLGLRAAVRAWAQRTVPLLDVPTLDEFVALGRRVAALEAAAAGPSEPRPANVTPLQPTRQPAGRPVSKAARQPAGKAARQPAGAAPSEPAAAGAPGSLTSPRRQGP